MNIKNIIHFIFLFLITTISLVAIGNNINNKKIVVLTSDVAEIVNILKASNLVVGKENNIKISSLSHAKNIGTFMNLSVEPILNLKPDIVLGNYQVQPITIYNKLKKYNINAINVHSAPTVNSFYDAIIKVGILLKQEEKAKSIADNWKARMNPKPKNNLRYILSYDGNIVAGKNTISDLLINLAGGINAVADIDGLKPLSKEGWIKANPDIIIAKHQEKALGGLKKFLSRKEIKNSKAAKNNNIFFWDVHEFFVINFNTPSSILKLHNLGRKALEK